MGLKGDLFTSKLILAAPLLTSLTKSIKFIPNNTSIAMDTANGGVKLFGGLHRVHGGHSIVDLDMWTKFGLDFPIEVFKDFLTPNGIPFPLTETLVNSKLVSSTFATKYLSVSVGGALCAGISALDTYQSFKKRTLKEFSPLNTSLKGIVKIGTGIGFSNPVVFFLGSIDLTLAFYSSKNLDLQINYLEFNFSN